MTLVKKITLGTFLLSSLSTLGVAQTPSNTVPIARTMDDYVVIRSQKEKLPPEEQAEEGISLIPPSMGHALLLTPIPDDLAALTPGKWARCLVFMMRKPRAHSVGDTTRPGGSAFLVSGGSHGYSFVADNPKLCPPTWFKKGILLGKDKILVKNKVYTVTFNGLPMQVDVVTSETAIKLRNSIIPGMRRVSSTTILNGNKKTP